MAVWFATANGNINSAGRWAANPDGSGAVLTWPPASGDVLIVNGKLVTVNVNTNLGSTGQVRSDTTGGATSGGYFTLANGVSLTANVFSGAGGNCVFSNAASGFIVGQINGGTGTASYAVNYQGTGTLTITGDVNGGTATSALGVYNHTTGGTIDITGSLRSTFVNAPAIQNFGAGIINLTGDAIGCSVSGTNAATIRNSSTGTINITGNVSADSGSSIQNESSGTVTVSGYAQASTTASAISNSAQGVVSVGETRSASNGRGAVIGAFRYASATAAKSLPIVAGTQKTLSVLDVAALVPVEANVKSNVVYGDGAYTGTLTSGGGVRKISMLRRI